MKDNATTVQYNVTNKNREWKETFREGGNINDLHVVKGTPRKDKVGTDFEKNTAA